MKIKKKDWILIAVILIVAGGAYLLHAVLNKSEVNYVTVKVGGELQGTYSLAENQEVSINGGSNILVIQDGEAKMKEADCPDKLCVSQKAISANHESIICLPNKVVVEAVSEKESKMDAVTN